MIIASKLSQVEEIKKYLESHSDMYNKCIIFGKCTTNNGNSDDYLEIAIQTTDDNIADDDEALFDLFCTVDDITEGLFDLNIINSKNSRNITSELEKGVLIYG